MSLPAQEAPTPAVSQGVTQVHYINPEAEIVRLQDKLTEITKESEKRGAFIRSVAQEYFSQNPESYWFAGQAVGHAPSREEAIAHWREHGGPEGFGKKFPTPEKVMEFFRRLHVRTKEPVSLRHPILG